MEILVTGGAGFVGSHLCDRLIAEGHVVTCLDDLSTGSRDNVAHLRINERFRLMIADVCDPIDPALPRFDEIYNLACPASPQRYADDPIATMRICSEGVGNVLSRGETDGARVFHASTSEIYGDPEVHPQPEDYTGNVHTIGPRACYDEGKRFAETLVHSFAEQRGVDAKMARVFNTYGPRMHIDDGRLISNVVVQALTGADVTVHGDGSQTRSLCYVDDTVDGILKLMRSDVTAGTPVNLGNPDELTVSQIVALVLVLTGSRSRISYLPLPLHDPMRRQPDIERADELLDWRPQVALEDGLTRTIAYFRDKLDLVQPEAAAG